MVSLVSVGLAIARPDRKGNSSVDEFIASGPNVKGVHQSRRSSPDLLSPAQVFRPKPGFRGACDFLPKCTPRESTESYYSAGDNTMKYLLCAVLQAFHGTMNR